MANVLDAVVQQLLAQGLLALRENARGPATVNRAYEPLAGERGSTIDVPLPSTLSVTDVTPAATPPAGQDLTPTKIPISLSEWKEVRFNLSDKEQMQVQAGTIPMFASESIRRLANHIDAAILLKGADTFFSVASAGNVGIFNTDTTDATNARKELNRFAAPLDPRWFLLDPAGEANALNLRAFQDASFSADGNVIRNGEVGRKLGFGFLMDQNVQSRTNGTANDFLVNSGAGVAVGVKTIPVDSVAGGTAKKGDKIFFANHTQTYVVTVDLTLGPAGSGNLLIEPGLLVAVLDNNAIKSVGNTQGVGGTGDPSNVYVANLAYHPDAIAFATRPLAQSQHPGAVMASAVDAISQLSLRLEFSREHKRDAWSWDILYGVETIRRELGVVIIG